MKKFEYYALYIKPGEDVIRLLDRYGEARWEAFHMMPDGMNMVVYLKREIP